MVFVEKCKSCKYVSAHDEMNPKFRETMEDTYRIIDGFRKDASCGFFAVFDGHGGQEVSEYLQRALDKNLAIEMAKNDASTVEQQLQRAFLTTDAECCKVSSAAGATGIVCLVKAVGNKRILYTANVGDSRAVLCTGNQAVRLSRDHKAGDEMETKRIEKEGGFVVKNRVFGVLAVSRSFGDSCIKQYVIAEPYTSSICLDDHQKKGILSRPSPLFLVIACDGVWDVLSDEYVNEFVKKIPKDKHSKAAELLVHEAMKKGSTDNITCLVVFF